jgi:hypothetical protein
MLYMVEEVPMVDDIQYNQSERNIYLCYYNFNHQLILLIDKNRARKVILDFYLNTNALGDITINKSSVL